MRGEYGKEVGNAAEQLTAHMDKLISGCFRGFEQSYNKLERAIRESMDWRKNGIAGAAAATGRQRRRQTTLQLMAGGGSSSSDEDYDETQSQEEEDEEEAMDADDEQEEVDEAEGEEQHQVSARPSKRLRSGAAAGTGAVTAAQPAIVA